MFISDNFQVYNIVSSAYSTIFTYVTDDSLSDLLSADYFADLINRVKTGDKLLVQLQDDANSVSCTFFNDNANVSISVDSTVIVPVSIADVSTASTAYSCAPSGVIMQVGGVLNTAITVASAVVTFSINSTAVTDASLTFTTAMTAGTRVVATPTAANVIPAAAVISAATNGASTTASVANLFAKIACFSNIQY